MGLLDDLKKEVRNIRAREIQMNAELDAQQAFYLKHMRPVMMRGYDYFAELVENLNIVAPDIKAMYPLNPLLEHGVALKQAQYNFRSDNKDCPREIDIYCKCTLEKPHEFYLNSQKSVLAHTELLDGYNFPYHCKNRLDRHYEVRGATFVLEGPMIAHIRIAATPADRLIHIIFRNIERQPIKRYKFAPEYISDAFLERLAKVLVREVPQLIEQQVDDSFRHELRKRLDEDNRQNKKIRAPVDAAREAEMTAERDANPVLRTKSIVVGKLREALKVREKR